MKKLKVLLVTLIGLTILSCSSDSNDDCTKTITIPQVYFVNNQSYSYDTTQEVPCDFPEPQDAEVIEPPALEDFSYTVLNFMFTPDTGNNTNRLQFEIQLNNPNNFAATGLPILTLNTDGLESRGNLPGASIPCLQINANGNCILTYDQQSSLDIGLVNSIDLINVEYFLTN